MPEQTGRQTFSSCILRVRRVWDGFACITRQRQALQDSVLNGHHNAQGTQGGRRSKRPRGSGSPPCGNPRGFLCEWCSHFSFFVPLSIVDCQLREALRNCIASLSLTLQSPKCCYVSNSIFSIKFIQARARVFSIAHPFGEYNHRLPFRPQPNLVGRRRISRFLVLIFPPNILRGKTYN